VNGVRNKSSKSKIALYQPLTLLDMVVYYKENANIKRIKELHCLHQYQALSTDIRKSSIAMFVNEILNKTVKEESKAEDLFDFLITSLMLLDDQKTSVENFHLIFLIKLSRFLGFGAHNVSEVLAGRMVDVEEEAMLRELLTASYTDKITITNVQRRNVLNVLLKFYKDHIDSLGEIKSIQVLKEVLGN
jgi:DNA repair protein RecO (recombination protein O)